MKYLAALVIAISWNSILIAQVDIELRIVNVDVDGSETPASGTRVWLIPRSGQLKSGYTDRSGAVNFRVAETSSLVIRVGDLPRTQSLHKMSGRFSQRTSIVYTAEKVASVQGSRLGFDELIDDLSDLYSDELPSEAATRVLKEIRERLIRDAQKTIESATPEVREEIIGERDSGLRSLDFMLRRPGKLGLTCEYSKRGALITGIRAGGPADRAGLRVGTYIAEVDGFAIGSGDGQMELPQTFRHSENGLVNLRVVKYGNTMSAVREVQVQLEMPD